MTINTDHELELDSAWWPDFIPPITDADLIRGDLLTVAEIVEPWGPESYRQVYTGLTLDLVDPVQKSLGSIHTDIETTGPHPSRSVENGLGSYEPRF